MTTIFPYGSDNSLSIDFPSDVLLADCATPRGTPIADVAEAVRAALREPLEYPTLDRAIVPDDKIVLALEPGLPQAATIVAVVIETLCAAGVAPGDITVLRSMADADAGDPRDALAGDLRTEVHLETHDPDHSEHLEFLAATRGGRPVYLNRTLCDADYVVSLGCLRPEQPGDCPGKYGRLYPTFSDAKTLRRFRNPSLVESVDDIPDRARREVDAIGWLAGVRCTVQVVPGAGDELLHVLAGDLAVVHRRGRELCEDAWRYQVPGRAKLVLAAISGGRAQQTWENVGRALTAALGVVTDDGAIALVTELEADPGPAVQGLADIEDLDAAVQQIRKHRPVDALPATELVHALGRARVYFLSRLADDVLEDVGIAAVSEPDDIARLAARADSCILLANAQNVLAKPEGD